MTFSDVSTLLLGSSRFLNAEIDRSDHQPAEAELNVNAVDFNGGRVQLQLVGSDPQGLRAFAIIDNNAQQPVAADAIVGKQIQRELTVGFTPEAGTGKLTFILVDQGGNHTRITRELNPLR